MIKYLDVETYEINFLATGEEEVLQNIRTILTTPKGSIPLDRQFGIDTSLLDLPLELAENLLTVQIIEAIQNYEPRAHVVNVAYEKDHRIGKLKPKVKVEIDEFK